VNSPDPRNDLFSTFHSKGSTNWNKVNNPDLDKYLQEAVEQTDIAKGVASALKAQDILLKNAMFGQIVLYNYISRSAYWNYYHPTLKKYPVPGTPGNGYNIFAGHLGPGIVYINPKDASFSGRPAATI
jgi:ABC-type transport system substrate-binding protein